MSDKTLRYLVVVGFVLIIQGSFNFAFAQPCDLSTPSYTVDLSANADSIWISPDTIRNGLCCDAMSPDRCVEFILYLAPDAQGIRFDICSGAVPPGALFYQVSCANPTAVGDTMCLSSAGPHRITFCKPGNNKNKYCITSIGKPKVSDPIAVSDGCTGIIYASGYQESSINWTSVPFSVTYNSYMSCSTACDTVVVTAQPGYPPYIDYEVSGIPHGGCSSIIIRDTVRVYFVSDKQATILPENPVICFGGINATLTANGFGGAPPYSYLWSTGSTTQAIDVGVGTYWVKISDTTNCPPVFDTVTVVANASLIEAKAGPDLSICMNNPTAIISGSIIIATGGKWTGGTGNYSPSDTSLNLTYTPSAAELAAGNFQLILTTTGNGPCPFDTDTVNITVTNAPVVTAGNDTTVCSASLQLNGNITIATGGAWATTGTGTFSPSSSVLNPLYTFSNADTTAGMVTFILTSTGNGNCIPEDDTLTVFIADPLSASASAPDTVCTGFPISISGTSSTLSGEWITLGSGTFSPSDTLSTTSYIPSLADITAGSVTLIFNSTDNKGCVPASDTVTIVLLPGAQALFTTADVCFNQTTFFTNNSVSNGGVLISYLWDFGDGSPTSTVVNPSHNYTVPGTYSVSLIVESNYGCIDTLEQLVSVFPLPLADFSSTAQCYVDSVSFIDLSTVSTGSISIWQWDFGDGNSSLVQSPWHSYSSPGVYTVSLVVTTSSGCKDTIQKTFNVDPAPKAAFASNEICLDESAVFNDSSSILFGSIVSWEWTFGDGNQSAIPSPTHDYINPGTYSVTLVVVSDKGCEDTLVKTIEIHPMPIADFSESSYCIEDGTSFINASSIDWGSLAYQWSFGDGNSDTASSPKHFYAALGNYSVTLIVTSGEGCTDTLIKTIGLNPNPKAGFTYNPTTGPPGTRVYFTDNSSGAVSWYWTFGDSLGGNSSSQNTSYQYNDGGIYRVRQVVYNIYNCTDTIEYIVIITQPPNIATGFTPNGDGMNDMLLVLGGPYRELDFRVYNNWGEMIFVSNNQSDGWDGTKAGVPQPMGVYVYTVKAETIDGRKFQSAGDVTLIR